MTDPKIVDAELAELFARENKLERSFASTTETLHRIVGDRKRYVGRTQRWGMTDEQALQNAAEGVGVATYDVRRVQEAFARRDEITAELSQVRARESELDAIYRAAPWSRFFLVTDGHIHSSMSCHTCRPTTEFGWLPELSGETEAEAVAAHGALLCTVCFPSAPVEWTNFYEVKAAAAKAAQCPGSGTWDWEEAAKERGEKPAYGRRYQTCPHCNKTVSITETGKLRAHKKEA